MEEKSMSEVLEEILKQSYLAYEQTKDIENVILMFVDWLVREVRVKLVWQDDIGYVKQWTYEPAGWRAVGTPYYAWTTSELFVHWYEKIFNKKS